MLILRHNLLLTQVSTVLVIVCFVYVAYSGKEIFHIGIHYPYSYFFDFALIHAISDSEKQELKRKKNVIFNMAIACIILF